MVNDPLNDLDGKQWIYHSISWFTLKYAKRQQMKAVHPATYPSELAERFIELFTKKGEWVLDPFSGSGSTLLASRNLKRNAIGVEIVKKFHQYARSQLDHTLFDVGKQIPLYGDSMKIGDVLAKKFGDAIPQFKLVMTSPPYWNILKKSRGGSDSSHKKRITDGKQTTYSDQANDLGNCENYGEFLGKLMTIFRGIHPFLAEKAHLALVLQNFRDDTGEFVPFAWDVAYKLQATGLYSMQQEQIWCQTDKKSGIWGYPSTYITNTNHQYVIVLKKVNEMKEIS